MRRASAVPSTSPAAWRSRAPCSLPPCVARGDLGLPAGGLHSRLHARAVFLDFLDERLVLISRQKAIVEGQHLLALGKGVEPVEQKVLIGGMELEDVRLDLRQQLLTGGTHQ